MRKPVFPAGGLGPRFLPATNAQPKEMLPVVDKPIIQYGVEEAIHSGIQNIIIVTGRGKSAIEDHFDVASSWRICSILAVKRSCWPPCGPSRTMSPTCGEPIIKREKCFAAGSWMPIAAASGLGYIICVFNNLPACARPARPPARIEVGVPPDSQCQRLLAELGWLVPNCKVVRGLKIAV